MPSVSTLLVHLFRTVNSLELSPFCLHGDVWDEGLRRLKCLEYELLDFCEEMCHPSRTLLLPYTGTMKYKTRFPQLLKHSFTSGTPNIFIFNDIHEDLISQLLELLTCEKLRNPLWRPKNTLPKLFPRAVI